jgi:hypothetical protein
MENIVCKKCDTNKHRDNFRDRKNKKNGKSSWCKDCYREYNNSIYQPKPKTERPKKEIDLIKVKIKAKERMLKHRYNLTTEEYNNLYNYQNGECAICSKPVKLGGKGGMYVDHCHSTGKVRGFLCNPCNSALGMFKDDVTILQSAINYLQKHK